MARLATGMQSASEAALATGMKGLKTIVASNKETPVCQIMDGLMEQKPTGITENYIYLDPKAPPAPPGGGSSNACTFPKRNCIRDWWWQLPRAPLSARVGPKASTTEKLWIHRHGVPYSVRRGDLRAGQGP